MSVHEAFIYKNDGKDVVCLLCGHQCRVRPGKTGRCGVRQNIEGAFHTLVYGELVAEHIDPIEKKPLFHVLPGSLSFSISTMGCNFTCSHCQNNSISQVKAFSAQQLRGKKTTPEQVVENALVNGCQSISYTYVEPTVFYEFAYDCAVLATERGIKNIFVSNGYMSRPAAEKIAANLDAINIDLKAFSDEFYQKVCGARLQPVLDSIRLFKEMGVWVEVTTLIIPGMNDSNEELEKIASFLVDVDPGIPWHVTAFYPTYKMTDRRPTPRESLTRACRIGRKAGVQFTYEGNVHGAGGEDTICPGCGENVIGRRGFTVTTNRLKNGGCPGCGVPVPGVWV